MPISSVVLIWTVNPSAGRERLTRDGVRARRAVRLYADAFLGLDIAIGASRTSASLACDVS
jgi:hypothetical protein